MAVNVDFLVVMFDGHLGTSYFVFRYLTVRYDTLMYVMTLCLQL